jgi:GTP-binding protein Era
LDSENFKSGFVGIVGRPNVGKSTFLNRVIGEKVAIVTDKPQTTRDRIMGIHHFEGGQIVFLDTPGVHQSKRHLNKQMVSIAVRSFDDADILLCFFEPPVAELGYPNASAGIFLDEENSLTLEHLAKTDHPKFLVLNKVDVLDEGAVAGEWKGRDLLQPLREALERNVKFERVFVISAATGEGIEELVSAVIERLPHGPPYFPEDMFTDQTDRTFAAEVIREKLFEFTRKEIPYSSAVTIEEFEEEEDPVRIRALIHVERASQKGIVIGHKGQMVKQIGTAAREDIQEFLGCKVFLKLDVQVSKDWSKDNRIMKRIEYGA